MTYLENILDKLHSFITNLETLYDDIFRETYKNDLTKIVTKSSNDTDKFFVQLGSDIDQIKLIYDKITENNIVIKSDLVLINEKYKKYKSVGDV